MNISKSIKSKENWVELLLAWSSCLDRELPWRERYPRNPYYVWVSEIMLQQTRTEAVKPYFNTWIHKFPTVHDLAYAEESEVLHTWQGLGYYNRARNLQRAAQEVESKYGGNLPETRSELESLPGIGSYTAGAILSIAYGQREVAVDGNILRIYSRLYNIEEGIMKSKGKRKITQLVEETLPIPAGIFNEALMDLGQEICIPKYPKCGECPISMACDAYALGKEKTLPIKTKKKAPKEYYVACALIMKDNKFLMHKRADKGMLASMWEFPMIIDESADKAVHDLFILWGEESNVDSIWTYSHTFSHQIWHMSAYLIKQKNQIVLDKNLKWFSSEEYMHIPLAGPHARLAAWAKKILK